MRVVIARLWSDEAGFIVSTELVLVATILVLSMVVGLATVRDAVIQELADVADAIGVLNQSYSFSGVTGHSSSISGSSLADLADFCDPVQNAGASPSCLDFTIAPATAG